MTFYDYTCVLAGHIIKNNDSWRQSRLVAYTTYVMNSAKDGRMSEAEFYPLLGDKEASEPETPYTQEELAAKYQEAIEISRNFKP